jgi:hypothetical protein
MSRGIPITARCELVGLLRGSGRPNNQHYNPLVRRCHSLTTSVAVNFTNDNSRGLYDGRPNASNSSTGLILSTAHDRFDIGDNLVVGIFIHFLIGAVIANPDLATAAAEHISRLVYRTACVASDVFHGSSIAVAHATADRVAVVVHTLFGAIHAAAVYTSTLVGSTILSASDHPRRSAATSFVLFTLFGRRRGRGQLQRLWRQQRGDKQRQH